MTRFPDLLQKRLEKLDADSCRRNLLQRQGIDFSSNDYLGFSQDKNLKALATRGLDDIPLGSSASRLLRGQLKVFDEAEEILAAFCGRETALLYATGYQANVGLLSALLAPQDVVFSDSYNHASIIDGIRLSGARKRIFPHADLVTLRNLLQAHSDEKNLKLIVTESLYGMDGDIAPLHRLVDLAEEFSALLVVDEAHATGLWGDFSQNQGGGLVQSLGLSERVFATVHPGGKAFGLGGAWVCGDRQLKEYLVNCSRSFIFSTAPLPALPVFLKAAVGYWKEVGMERAQEVLNRSQYLQKQFRHYVEIPPVQGPILPVILGENHRALQSAANLQQLGFDVRAIRPPTVPKGSARLRLTLNWNQSIDDLDRLAQAFGNSLLD